MPDATSPRSESSADVVVVGGGPAGSTAASLLKRHRPSACIVLVERDPFPRHHVGESLLPESKRVLAKMGVLPAVDAAGYLRKGGITYRWHADRPLFTEEFARLDAAGRAPEYSWQVDRGHYDALLLAHAASLGVDVWQPAAAQECLFDGERVVGVRVRREDGEHVLHAGHVIDASGQSRLLGRRLGIEQLPQDLGDLAVYRYYRGFRWDPSVLSQPGLARIFFAATSAGWLWVIALSTELVSVGLVTRKELVASRDLDALFDEQVREVPEARDLLAGAEQVRSPWTDGPVRSERIRNWSYAHARTAGPGWFLAGDAAAFVDPILSSGVHLAHRSALNAVNAIATIWAEPSGDHTELYEAYSSFHRDLCRGFHEMARWWYHSRKSGIEDWWREANVLARRTGREGLDDVRAFMQFAAGYFSDVRFDKLGVGFGVAGLAVCFDAISGQEGAADAASARSVEGDHVYALDVDRVELGSHLATYVETDRWWRLPLVKLVRGDVVITYRPRVLMDEDRRPLVEPTLELLGSILDTFDGVHGYANVVEAIGVAGAARDLLSPMIADLTSLGVLRETGVRARVGRFAPEIARRDAPLHLVAASFRILRLPALTALTVSGPRPDHVELGYSLPAGGEGRYRILSRDPELASAVLQALMDAVDGRRGADDVVRAVRAALGRSDRELHDLCNVVLSALVSLGVFAAAPCSPAR